MPFSMSAPTCKFIPIVKTDRIQTSNQHQRGTLWKPGCSGDFQLSLMLIMGLCYWILKENQLYTHAVEFHVRTLDDLIHTVLSKY